MAYCAHQLGADRGGIVVVVRTAGHVQLLEDSLAAVLIDPIDNLLQLVFAARTEDDLGAFARESVASPIPDHASW
jgi:hypothetical protein